MIRRCDRYILAEMIGPFLVSLGGLLLFILLNLILSLSDLMVDRGVGIVALVHLLVLKLPSLLVLALPVSGLFATFLGLGRLVHDREVMALEAAGISLRRILLPLVIAAVVVAGVDFVLYNWAVPASEHVYQQKLTAIIFRQGVPHIRANTFFKGPEGEFFYVRSYDENTGTLHEVIVYDVTGKLFPQSKAAVTILTAGTGRWSGDSWDLDDGKVYGYDHDGLLIYTGGFAALQIAVGQVGSAFLFGSRTPAEMGIGELRRQIKLLRKSGAAVDDLVVESNLKVAIPFATIIFVLFGGAASLIFGWRSRAVGVVISLLLVGLFQGVLLWTETLGRRGIIPAPLGAWFPNIIFGVAGVLLFMRLDRLGHHDWWGRMRRILPFFVILISLMAFSVHGQEIPLDITSDGLTISSDRKHVAAKGDVQLAYGDTTLAADEASVDQDKDGDWRLRAVGNVQLKMGDGFSLSGHQIDVLLSYSNGALITRRATAVDFSGKSDFVNTSGETHTLIYQGADGKIAFGDDGELKTIDIDSAELSTCDCCGGVLGAQPYVIETGRLLLYPDQLIVAFNLTVKSFGVRVFWLPVYVQPLKETLDSPLFPAIGNSGVHGWFVKWNLPFYLDDRNYGAILFDYFTRFQEVGLGAVLRYAFAGQQGTIKGYYFPAKVGDKTIELSLNHTADLTQGWKITGGMSYRSVGEENDLAFSFSTAGDLGDWRLALSAARTTNNDDEQVRIDEHLPELALSRSKFTWGDLSATPRMSVGWYREWVDGILTGASLRGDGSISFAVSPLSFFGFVLTPKAEIRMTGYEASQMMERRTSFLLSIGLTYPGMKLSYTYQEVNGESPFEFDHLVAKNHLTWVFSVDDAIGLQVAGGIDLAAGTFDVLELTADWTLGARFKLTADYDPASSAFTYVTLSGDSSTPGASLTWSIPYDALLNRFDTATFDVHVGSLATGEIALTSDVDLNAGRLATVSVDTRLTSGSGWGISAGGEYDWGEAAIVDPSFGLFYDFYDCLRVGIERTSGQVWVYTSILAFPEAILRYAPVSTQFEIGE